MHKHREIDNVPVLCHASWYNKHKEGLDFSPMSGVSTGTFRSAGFANAILDGAAERGARPTFVIPGGIAKNWNVINLPVFVHDSK